MVKNQKIMKLIINSFTFLALALLGCTDKEFIKPEIISTDTIITLQPCTTIISGQIRTIAGLPNTSSTNSSLPVGGIIPPNGFSSLQNGIYLNDNSYIASDNQGNIYYTTGHNRIQKIDPEGIITTVVGNGGFGAYGNGGLSNNIPIISLGAIAIDNFGDLYFAGGNTIRKINMSTGVISTVVGNGLTTYFGNNVNPLNASISSDIKGMCFDSQNNLYFSDSGFHIVRKVTAATNLITIFAGIPNQAGNSGNGWNATSAKLTSPASLACDNSGKIYIGSAYDIRVVSTNGFINNFVNSPYSYFTKGGSNLYVVGTTRILRIPFGCPSCVYFTAGTSINGDSGDCGQALSANITPGMIAYSQGNQSLYFTDYQYKKIRQIKL